MRVALCLLSIAWLVSGQGGMAWADSPSQGSSKPSTQEDRRQRELELRREVKQIQDELRALNREPVGVTKSIVPRSELSDQPTRSLRESLESVPGVSARQGQGGRDLNLSIRGSGK